MTFWSVAMAEATAWMPTPYTEESTMITCCAAIKTTHAMETAIESSARRGNDTVDGGSGLDVVFFKGACIDLDP